MRAGLSAVPMVPDGGADSGGWLGSARVGDGQVAVPTNLCEKGFGGVDVAFVDASFLEHGTMHRSGRRFGKVFAEAGDILGFQQDAMWEFL